MLIGQNGSVLAPAPATVALDEDAGGAQPEPATSASAPKPSPAIVAPKPSTSTAPPDPAEEVKLLERAYLAVKTRPAEALALATEHARRYPSGMLAQEREVIAIEALLALGRGAEAKARADRFRARFPGSSHTRRIDAMLSR